MTCVQHSLTTTQTTTSPQVLVPSIEDSQSVFVTKNYQSKLVSSSQPPQSKSKSQSQPQSQSQEGKQKPNEIVILRTKSRPQGEKGVTIIEAPQTQLLSQLQPQEEVEKEVETETPQSQIHLHSQSQIQEEQEGEQGTGTPLSQPTLQEETVTESEGETQVDRGGLIILPTVDSSPESSSLEQSNSAEFSNQLSASNNHSHQEDSTSERGSEKDSELSYDSTTNDDNDANLSVDKEDTLENEDGDIGARNFDNQSVKSDQQQETSKIDSQANTNKNIIANASSTLASHTVYPPQHQQQKPNSQHIIVQPQQKSETTSLAKEEHRERLLQERRRRERQCAFPTDSTADLQQHTHQQQRKAMGSFNKGTYVDQAQHHPHRTHQRQMQMYPQQQQQHHHHHQPGHVLKRPNTARSTAPPPQPKETMNHHNRPTHTSSPSRNLNQQQHPHYISSQNRDRYITHNTNTNAANNTANTDGPLYWGEEVQELKEYSRVIQTQERQLTSLQSIQSDLEVRLEHQTAERIQLEATLENQQGHWAERCRRLETERDEWKEMVNKEQAKNDKLLGFVKRKEKEILKMIQRKYEPNQRPTSRSNTNVPIANQPRINHEAQQQQSMMVGGDPLAYLRSPREMLEANASMQAVRETNATRNLLDFFGL